MNQLIKTPMAYFYQKDFFEAWSQSCLTLKFPPARWHRAVCFAHQTEQSNSSNKNKSIHQLPPTNMHSHFGTYGSLSGCQLARPVWLWSAGGRRGSRGNPTHTWEEHRWGKKISGSMANSFLYSSCESGFIYFFKRGMDKRQSLSTFSESLNLKVYPQKEKKKQQQKVFNGLAPCDWTRTAKPPQFLLNTGLWSEVMAIWILSPTD